MNGRHECYISGPGLLLLNQACTTIALAFNAVPLLVGSALERRDFRDVNVRVVIPDDRYEQLFGPGSADLADPKGNALWSLLCSSVGHYLGHVTRLRVEFQVQPQSVALRYHDRPKLELGIFRP